MALDFLAQIPGILARGLGAAGQGIQKIPSALGKLGELGEDDQAPNYRPPIPMTPGFNPEASMPQIRQNPMAQAAQTSVFGQRKKPAPAMPPMVRPPIATTEPAPNVPGGVVGAGPIVGPQTRAEEMQEARDVYRNGPTPTGFGARLKGALLPALAGALKGYGATGDIGGAIGGGLARGAVAGFSPRTERGMEFEEQIKPKILERYGLEDQQAAANAAAQQAQLEQEYKRSQIANQQSEAQRRADQTANEREKLKQGPKYTPHWVETDRGYIDLNAPENKGKQFKGKAQQDAYTSTEGGILNRRTGQITRNPYAKDRSVSGTKEGKTNTALLNSIKASTKEFDKLKADANAETDMDAKAGLIQQARDKAQEMKDLYGDDVEIGEQDGWPYVKARVQQPTPQMRSAQKPVADEKFIQFMMDETGKTKAQAIEQLTRDGYEYRR